jgi:hypothetical protein
MSGKVGDCGRSSPRWTLYQPNGGANEEMDLRLSSREISELSEQPIITHDIGCMAGSMGVDNIRFVPPFAPHFSGEDGIFSTTLTKCDRSALWGVVAHAVIHDASGLRPYTNDVGLGWDSFAMHLIQSAPLLPGSEQPNSLLEQCGEWLVRCCQASEAEFKACLKRLRASIGVSLLGQLETAFARCADDRWRAELTEERRRILAFIDGSGGSTPEEFPDTEEGLSQLQEELGNLGALFKTWPRILEVLSARGEDQIRFSRAL